MDITRSNRSSRLQGREVSLEDAGVLWTVVHGGKCTTWLLQQVRRVICVIFSNIS